MPEGRPAPVLARVASTLALAVVGVALSVSFASLVFRGPLAGDLGRGIGLTLTGLVVMGVFVAARSRIAGHVAGPQDATAVVLGVVAARLVEDGASTDTVVVYLLLATLASGLLLLALGALRLGTVARLVPFPVTGGFLAGTGIVMLASTADLLSPPTGGWLGADALVRWVPAVAVGLVLALAQRVPRVPAWVVPGLLLLMIAGSNVAFALAGVGRSEAAARGWVLADTGRFEPRFEAVSAADAEWSMIGAHLPDLGVVLVLVSVAQLLRYPSIELETEREVDVDHDLAVVGSAGAVAAPFGALPGYTILSETVMLQRLLGPDRLAAVGVAVLPLAVLAAGGGLLTFVPVALVGAVLVFLGVGFVLDWTWAVRRRLPPADLALLVAIAAMIAAVGFLPGVALGVVVALALFVLRYSRVDVVRRRLTSAVRRSNVQRPVGDERLLDRHGQAVEIFELQGYLFFGTADRIVAPLRERQGDEPLRAVVLDFRRVSGLDSSAVAAFDRLVRLGREREVVLLVGGHRHELDRQLRHLVGTGPLVLEPDLDRALQRAEDLLLASLRPAGSDGDGDVLPDGLAPLLDGLPALEVAAGETLLEQGRTSRSMFVLERGSVTVSIEGADGAPRRRRRITAPAVLGEIGYYLERPASATVVADTPVTVRRLDQATLDDLAEHDPLRAARIHQAFARDLAERVLHSDGVVRQLAE